MVNMIIYLDNFKKREFDPFFWNLFKCNFCLSQHLPPPQKLTEKFITVLSDKYPIELISSLNDIS